LPVHGVSLVFVSAVLSGEGKALQYDFLRLPGFGALIQFLIAQKLMMVFILLMFISSQPLASASSFSSLI
jgi:hypothetical protein